MYEYVYRYVYRYHIWSVFVGFLADLSDATDPLDVVKGMSTLIMVCLVVQVSRWFINSQYIYNCEDILFTKLGGLTWFSSACTILMVPQYVVENPRVAGQSRLAGFPQ